MHLKLIRRISCANLYLNFITLQLFEHVNICLLNEKMGCFLKSCSRFYRLYHHDITSFSCKSNLLFHMVSGDLGLPCLVAHWCRGGFNPPFLFCKCPYCLWRTDCHGLWFLQMMLWSAGGREWWGGGALWRERPVGSLDLCREGIGLDKWCWMWRGQKGGMVRQREILEVDYLLK